MRIGLIDVDGHNGFPNLALMKISAWHKANGDQVEWYSPLLSADLDKVYMSKVFTFTSDYEYPVLADEIIKGGTGYQIGLDLPNEVDDMLPDYSIYPSFNGAIGFLTRGCIRKCPWCVVPEKEGKLRPYRRWDQVKRPDSPLITFLDNNVLASDHGLIEIDKMTYQKVKIDFNQGMDARLIDKEVAELLSKVKWIRHLRMSCDTDEMIPIVENAVRLLGEAGVKPYRIFVYVLVKDIGSALRRVEALRRLGVDPFAQPYIDFSGQNKTTQEQRKFARWCNMKSTFKSCTWEQYKEGI